MNRIKKIQLGNITKIRNREMNSCSYFNASTYNASYTYIYGTDQSGGNMSFNTPKTAVGTSPLSSLSMSSAGTYYINITGTNNFTEFGAVGQFVAGTFTAKVAIDTMQGRPTYPVTGTFRIRRTNW